jgi:hypothetical protein
MDMVSKVTVMIDNCPRIHDDIVADLPATVDYRSRHNCDSLSQHRRFRNECRRVDYIYDAETETAEMVENLRSRAIVSHSAYT